ncbi:hypothetical protein GCM10010503_13480 [Streptomyces lucensis JCM 4490]|uniref:Uncharacterized protein n=1 Tax=Streptomyces lucensis JCM 4490 TaxID=1306176 RepID=A0A918MNG6_9ACTN|nr:hypothetical protein GCM10010503_13480 [Streptomyces lucensis JCM 4490]
MSAKSRRSPAGRASRRRRDFADTAQEGAPGTVRAVGDGTSAPWTTAGTLRAAANRSGADGTRKAQAGPAAGLIG